MKNETTQFTKALLSKMSVQHASAWVAVAFGLASQVVVPAVAEEIKGDQYFEGDVVIPADTIIMGNVVVMNGLLIVEGTIKGNVWVRGGLVVGEPANGQGLIKGDVHHEGDGGFLSLLAVNPGGLVKGNIVSFDAAFVGLFGPAPFNASLPGEVRGNIVAVGADLVVFGGVVRGDLVQEGDGDLLVLGFPFALDEGIVYGNVEESGDGSVTVNGGLVNGNIEEYDSGDVELFWSTINGNIGESGAGTVVNFGSTVSGQIDED